MARRKSNKQVKAMMEPIIQQVSGATCVWWSDSFLCGQVPSDDEYCSYDDVRIIINTVSIKANQEEV